MVRIQLEEAARAKKSRWVLAEEVVKRVVWLSDDQLHSRDRFRPKLTWQREMSPRLRCGLSSRTIDQDRRIFFERSTYRIEVPEVRARKSKCSLPVQLS